MTRRYANWFKVTCFNRIPLVYMPKNLKEPVCFGDVSQSLYDIIVSGFKFYRSKAVRKHIIISGFKILGLKAGR